MGDNEIETQCRAKALYSIVLSAIKSTRLL